MSVELNRKHLSTSRLMEFFTEKELTMQIGYDREHWQLALIKELIDNALDATEAAGVMPVIDVTVEDNFIAVQDNGLGLPEEVITKSLDYSIRVSDKAAYVSPSRGQLGNALKCVWAAGFVANGEHGKIEITAQGKHHVIDVTLDRIKQQPVIEHTITESAFVKNGTFIKLHWKNSACLLDESRYYNFYNLPELLDVYIAFNPHLTIGLNGEISNLLKPPSSPFLDETDFISALIGRLPQSFDKWISTNQTSPHWYTVEKLKTLMASYIANETSNKQTTVREFVAEFKGLSGSAKQKAVTDKADLPGKYLNQLVKNGDIDTEQVKALLAVMQAESLAVKPKALGVIGESFFIQQLNKLLSKPHNQPKYKILQGVADGLPFVLEVGFNYSLDKYEHKRIIAGINFTPLLSNPFAELNDILSDCRIDSWGDPVMVIIHLTCPRIDFNDRAKSKASLPPEINQALESAVKAVTVEWVKLKRKSDKDNRLSERQLREAEKEERKQKLTIKDAAYSVMEKAYLKASNNGTLPANARQIMYAARGEILELTGEKKLDDRTFTGKLLPNFMAEYPEICKSWDVVYDPRGNLIEPHTKHSVGMGTLAVRRYINSFCTEISAIETPVCCAGVTTIGAANRFKYVLFLEKEGFEPLLKAAQIREKYDIAVMSTKGFASVAARKLVEELSSAGVTVLIATDFDKAGLGIAHTLWNDSDRYKFAELPNVARIGLTLQDAKAMNLESEYVEYSDKTNPKQGVIKRGATEEEAAFLVSGYDQKAEKWHGQRIELNAMTSNQFIEWLERKFKEYGVKKVIPEDATVLEKLYTQACKAKQLQKLIDETVAQFSQNDSDFQPPQDLRGKVEEMLSKNPTLSWDEAVNQLAARAA